MGTLRSASDCSGMIVNGVILGEPSFTDEKDEKAKPLFIWDAGRLPNGVIKDNGKIVLDKEEQ